MGLGREHVAQMWQLVAVCISRGESLLIEVQLVYSVINVLVQVYSIVIQNSYSLYSF